MKKILVIDYDQSTLANLSGILSKEGYAVVTAGDGQSGWDKYNKESPDLVLMEAMLPKVHGFELCQRITSERNSQATVFIMTGVYKDRIYRTEALRTYGASEYFEKPLKMAEIMASIQAVLGKPEPRPEPEPGPVLEAGPAPVMAEPRKREKPKSDDDIFSLPADLDQLSRDIPRAKKPAAPRRESPPEARFESLADDLLRSVVIDPALQKKPAERTNGGNGNGSDGPDIDQFLKSALAGLDLSGEKVKAPKPAPAQPPLEVKPVTEKPVTEKPVIEKPVIEKPQVEKTVIPKPAFERPVAAKPIVEKPAGEKPKPVHMLPDSAFSVPDLPAKRSTLTPGDPGSDISPFFQPAKPKVEARMEVPKVQAPPPPPPVVPADRPLRPVQRPSPEPIKREAVKPEPVKREPLKPEPVKREPVKPEPIMREPVRAEVKIPEIAPTASGDIFRNKDIFEHVEEPKAKKGFPTLLAVGVGVAAVAVAAFLILRPKPAPKLDEGFRAAPAVTEQAPPVQPIVEAPPPVVKSEPVKPKPKPAAKKAAPEVAEGILAPVDPTAVLPLSDDKAGSGGAGAQDSATSAQAQAGAPPVKTEETAPPAKTEAEPPQGAPAETTAKPDPGLTVAASPAGPPAKEGDLVELGSVTSPPTLLKSVNPVYPQVAQQLGIEGTITVNALIDEKGNVIDTGILKGILNDKGLGKAAEAAVRKWKFEPARKDGVAVKVWKSFLIAFKAEKTATGASE